MENETLTISGTTGGASGSTNFFWSSPTTIREVKKETKRFWFFKRIITKVSELSVDEFFERAKMSKKEIVILDGIVSKYLNQIERASKLGQTAMVESMKDDIEIVKKEAMACIKGGIKEYIEKDQLDNLIKKSEKGIAVTPLKNFTRYIPDDVANKLEKLQSLNIFDEYVVVHYDPKREAVKMTKKEEEKAKDPILFGKINGSSNFYFIGDWVDEFCNLTLKEIVKITGEKTKSIK